MNRAHEMRRRVEAELRRPSACYELAHDMMQLMKENERLRDSLRRARWAHGVRKCELLLLDEAFVIEGDENKRLREYLERARV